MARKLSQKSDRRQAFNRLTLAKKKKPQVNRVKVIFRKKRSHSVRVLIFFAGLIWVFLFGMCLVYFTHVYNYINVLTPEINWDLLPEKMLMNSDNGLDGGMDPPELSSGSSDTSDVDPRQGQVAEKQLAENAVVDWLKAQVEQDKLADAQSDQMFKDKFEEISRIQRSITALESPITAQQVRLVETQVALALDQEPLSQASFAANKEDIAHQLNNNSAKLNFVAKNQAMLDIKRRELEQWYSATKAARVLRDQSRV